MTDHWPAIADAIPLILQEAHRTLHHPQLPEIMEARYRQGQVEYGDRWLSRPAKWFDGEAVEEAADLLIYLAMRAVLDQRTMESRK